jgi:hypothetical protein
MERDRIVVRKKYLERRGATVTVIDGRLEVDWPAQTEKNTTPVGINKVMRGEGKKAARTQT